MLPRLGTKMSPAAIQDEYRVISKIRVFSLEYLYKFCEEKAEGVLICVLLVNSKVDSPMGINGNDQTQSIPHPLEGNRVRRSSGPPHSRGEVHLADVSLIDTDASLTFFKNLQHFLSVQLPENQAPVGVASPGNPFDFLVRHSKVISQYF